MLTLIGNESLHLCATANVLQTGVLMCIALLLLLLCPLHFGINACNEWITYIGVVNVITTVLLFFDSSRLNLIFQLWGGHNRIDLNRLCDEVVATRKSHILWNQELNPSHLLHLCLFYLRGLYHLRWFWTFNLLSFVHLFKDCRIADGIEGKTERQVRKSTFNVSKV